MKLPTDIFYFLALPFVLVGTLLYVCLAIPAAGIYGGWLMARDFFHN